MADDAVILTGWKAIAKACGLPSIWTVKRRAAQYHMPYVRMGGKVTIPRSVLVEWVKGLCRETEGKEDEFSLIGLRNLGHLSEDGKWVKKGVRGGSDGRARHG